MTAEFITKYGHVKDEDAHHQKNTEYNILYDTLYFTTSSSLLLTKCSQLF